VNSINLRDIPTVQSVAMLLATFYIALNIISDLIIVYLVPKLRTAQ
jgi:peptide/nickel transport system permease protein